jgi:hypothetical protein
MVKVALWTPGDVGVKTTLTVHDPEAGTVAPQLLVATNWLAEAPLIVTPVTPVRFTGNVLLSVRVTDCAALLTPTFTLPRLSDAGLTDATAPPAPVNDAVSESEEPLMATVSVPVRVPEAVGVNVT